MRTGRKILTTLAVLAVAVPASILAANASAGTTASPDRLPLTVTNSTGRSEATHLYVLGTMNGRLGYVNASGAFIVWTGGALPPAPAPDASIPGPGNGGSKTIYIPKGISGRAYFSFGEKLKFLLTPDGLVQPAPWNSADPNHNILFDWSEFTYNVDGFWMNSTQVDMFAVPHAVTVTGSNGATKKTGEIVGNGRNNAINQIKSYGNGFQNLVVTRSDGTVLRVLNPSKGSETGKFPTNFLDSQITAAWNTYTSKTLTVVPFGNEPNKKFFGRTSGNVMNFTNTAGQQVLSVNKPSSADVWNCNGNLFAPNDLVQGPINRTLCAALNRGTLASRDVQPSGTAADFYKIPLSNHYSRIMHANMADGRAYGFAFDDVQAQESLVHDGSPTAAGIILSPFSGGTTPVDPPVDPPVTGGNRLISDGNGKCIDIPNAEAVDGKKLQMWDCNTTAAQRWTFMSDGSLQAMGKCMDVAWGSVDNGAVIQLANCSGNPAQKWVLAGAGDLVNPQANKCIDIKDINLNNGAALQLWECKGIPTQKWHKG